MILAVGATGVLGRELTRKLAQAGHPVRAATRTPQTAQDLAELGAEVIAADLIDRDSLVRACDGAHTVFASAHALVGRAITRRASSTTRAIAR